MKEELKTLNKLLAIMILHRFYSGLSNDILDWVKEVANGSEKE
jgi:hypothetical protein